MKTITLSVLTALLLITLIGCGVQGTGDALEIGVGNDTPLVEEDARASHLVEELEGQDAELAVGTQTVAAGAGMQGYPGAPGGNGPKPNVRRRPGKGRGPVPLLMLAARYYRQQGDDGSGLSSFIQAAKQQCPRPEKPQQPPSREERAKKLKAALECLMQLPDGQAIYGKLFERIGSRP